MQNACAPFENKRITVLGLGLLGRGVGDVAFLAECGANIIVTDKKSEDELRPSIEALKKYHNIVFHLGGHRDEDFTDTDLVIKAAGVPLDSPYIAEARRAGVTVAMSTALFAKYAREAGASIVGVTGTRGKSTVTHMIHHALIAAGKHSRIGGNVRGVSTLAQLPEVESGDVCVLELDSWQLQGFGDLEMSATVAVFTNLMPDHLNYYADMDQYFLDKSNIYRFQKAGDTLIAGKSVAARIARCEVGDVCHAPTEAIVPKPLLAEWDLTVPGAHNRENAALAAEALRSLGLNDEQIRSGLESFPGVEGRLQYVGERDGVRIYNDNNATTPTATLAALDALDNGTKNIVLIMGGSDKGLDMAPLVERTRTACKAVILLDGTGTDTIAAQLSAESFDSLPGALAAAFAAAESGDTILFSPAFASFGMFKNEYERNDDFLKLVRAALI